MISTVQLDSVFDEGASLYLVVYSSIIIRRRTANCLMLLASKQLVQAAAAVPSAIYYGLSSLNTAIGNSSVSSLKSMLLWLHDVVHFNAATILPTRLLKTSKASSFCYYTTTTSSSFSSSSTLFLGSYIVVGTLI